MSAPRKQRLSKSQERRLAAVRKGRTQPGSGSGRFRKEDVIDQVALGQAKYTEKETISLRFEDLKKVFDHAAARGLTPYVELLFRRPNPLDNMRVYVVFEGEFRRHFPK